MHIMDFQLHFVGYSKSDTSQIVKVEIAKMTREFNAPKSPRYTENPFQGWTTIEEVAIIIGRTKPTVWFWATNGRISNFQVGRKMRVVNIEEVREYAEKHPPNKKLTKK